MFGRRLESKSADGFLGNPPPETQPVTFDQAMATRAQSESAARLQAAGANAALGVDQWNQLTEPQRLMVRLALLFDGRDPALAKEIRTMAGEAIRTGLAPVAGWHRGLGLPGF